MLRHPSHLPQLKSVALPLEMDPLYPDVPFAQRRAYAYKAITATFVMGVPFTLLVWLMTVPQVVSPLTFVLTLVVMGTVIVGLNTWRNGQATRSIAHVLNETETR